jgi:hypothetical protein
LGVHLIEPPIYRKLVGADHLICGNGNAREVGKNIVEILPSLYGEQGFHHRPWSGLIKMGDLALAPRVALSVEMV